MTRFPISFWDRLTLSVAPKWTLERMRHRAAGLQLARHFEAAQPGRRTSGWARNRGDVNSVNAVAIHELRMHARDLVRNNAWAKKAQRVIANNTVGWGILPKATGAQAQEAQAIWKKWAGSTECESEGRHTFYGIQHLAMKSIVESGEVLIRKRYRLPQDGLSLPLQLQVLEGDYLDMNRVVVQGESGGPIINGVEFDAIGRRAAYWIFPSHPGSNFLTQTSKRVPASEIIHIHYTERPNQARGISWLGSSIVNLKDLDEYEDATLLKQKIAACFAAFVTDMEGTTSPLGEADELQPLVDTIEPGLVSNLPPGKSIEFANPPVVSEHDAYTKSNLRKIAAGMLVTYEDLTGDYSQVNFSSARMARLSHWANVHDWRWNMLIPLLCESAWYWAMETALAEGRLKEIPEADWTPPPMPMIEPDKEGLAYMRNVRSGLLTPSEMVREQGGDPDAHWEEYASDFKKLDAAGITLDVDARKVTQAGQLQIDTSQNQPDPSNRAMEEVLVRALEDLAHGKE